MTNVIYGLAIGFVVGVTLTALYARRLWNAAQAELIELRAGLKDRL